MNKKIADLLKVNQHWLNTGVTRSKPKLKVIRSEPKKPVDKPRKPR
ncbi:hypothetical protein [Chromatium okenii]|nr:hypothetical protein [Chromatium okenii]MBV5310807.1 hypothetical protein [Chromatium okenii]